jgi:hypothetical protein
MTSSMNPDQLAKYIQYRLAMMGEENAHHRFEDLCFRLAKATVASHLLPPTGPVSAGGDQGRDFESFRLDGAGGNVTRIFATAISTADTIVFACTTQKGSDAELARKIKHDVATATTRDPKPTVVYFYAASLTLAPAARHGLQDWAKREHGLSLEVIDQRAIAELLTDPPNRWLAQHYLSLPEGMLPQDEAGPVRPGWYEEAKRRFGSPTDRLLATHAEFSLVVRCARHAWQTEGLEVDDGLWLDLLSDLWAAPTGFSTEQGLRAFYEAFVYLYRGRERCGLEPHFSHYVSGLIAFDDLGLAQDIQCFASYLVMGAARERIALDWVEVEHLFRALVTWIETKIDNPPGPAVSSDLLVARGSLVFCEVPLADGPPTNESIEALATETLRWWNRALDVGQELISFPLLRLGQLLANGEVTLAESPDYDAFVARLDRACEQRHTSEGLAEHRRDRAIHFFEAGRFLDALPPILAAKRHWHNGDRIRGSLLASMISSQCLQRLDLIWAAKRALYDVIGVCNRTGDKQHGDLLTDAVFGLAELEYLSGEWATALCTYRLGLALHTEYKPDAGNFEKHPRLLQSVSCIVTMLVAGDLAAPGFLAWGQRVVESWDVTEELARFGDTLRSTWEEQGVSRGELGEGYPLHGPPLADLAPKRQVRWQALGLTWEVAWSRDYELESLGIEFAAVLQFIQAGLAKRCFHLLPTAVFVELVPWRAKQAPATPVPTPDGVRFKVMLPTSDDPTMGLRKVALVAAAMVVEAVSVEPQLAKKLLDLVGNLVPDGVFVGATALEGRGIVLPLDTWREAMTAPSPPAPGMQLKSSRSTGLPWRAGTSPLFSRAKADEHLRSRYETGFRAARPVLEAHGARPELHRLVAELRAEGWLDWQIVSALAGAVVSEHLNTLQRRGASRQAIEGVIPEQMRRAMNGDYRPPPWSPSFEESIRPSLEVSLGRALQTWGLQMNHPRLEISVLRSFLGERFMHFTDDLPPGERPIFPWEISR